VVQRLQRENVFLDVDSIDLGVDWFNVLTERVGACDALVAVIGRNWVSSTDKDNQRRLDDPDDFVRIEIEAALKRGVRVIPVLVDGAAMPKASELPESLKSLARRQGTEVSHARFEADVEKRTRALGLILEARRSRDAAEAEAARRAEHERGSLDATDAEREREKREGRQAAEEQRLSDEEQEKTRATKAAQNAEWIRGIAEANAARRADEERRAAEAEAAERAERAREAERGGTRGVTALKEALSIAQPALRRRLWDPQGKPPSFVALEGHQNWIDSAAFSPNATHVVTASWDRTARVWDLREKQPSFVALEGHQNWINSAAFSPDGTRVVTASYDMTARVWAAGASAQ
jgi:hypothetical protein